MLNYEPGINFEDGLAKEIEYLKKIINSQKGIVIK